MLTCLYRPVSGATSYINSTPNCGPAILTKNTRNYQITRERDTMKRVNISDCPPPMLTANGKRRGRKPGANSTMAQRSAANARERSRMRVLSGAFVELKGALPWVPKDTKLSKLDTLKLAAGYIAYLKNVLDEEPSTVESHVISTPAAMSYECNSILRHPVVYAWPYSLGKSSSTTAKRPEYLSSDISHPSSYDRLHNPDQAIIAQSYLTTQSKVDLDLALRH